MKIYTVSFFGHRYISNMLDIEEKLIPLLRELIKTKEYIDFLIGREGEFDQIAARAIRKVCKNLDCGNTHLTLVLPYMTAEFRDNEKYYLDYYDEVEICSESQSAYPKAAISIRNRAMIDRSDMVICFVEKKSGGAYRAARYAARQGKAVRNIYDGKSTV